MEKRGKLSRSKLKDEEELEVDGKNRQHDRIQRALDHIFRLLYILIYAVPIVLIISVGILFWHFYSTNDWSSIQTYINQAITFVVGYVIHLLQSLGMKKLQNSTKNK